LSVFYSFEEYYGKSVCGETLEQFNEAEEKQITCLSISEFVICL